MKTPSIFHRKNENELEFWSPFRKLSNLQRQLDRFAEEMSSPLSFYPQFEASGFSPACDVDETENQYLLSFDIPGMKKENIKIELKEPNILSVSGERKEESEKKGKSRYQSEKYYGMFERTFTLPSAIKPDQIEAHYNDGVLHVVVPKIEASKSKLIKIDESRPSSWDKKQAN